MEEKKRRRWLAGFLAVIMTITGVGIPLPFPSEASDVWPQKSTAPYYCLDGGKGWKKVDRYDMYKFDTMPSPLTETQAKRLFWAYPDNWSALKDAAKKFDPGLYAEIASTTSSANIVKYVKDDAGTKFAWVTIRKLKTARSLLWSRRPPSGWRREKKRRMRSGKQLRKIRQCHFRYCLFLTDLAPWIRSLFSEKSLSGISRRSSPRVCGTMDPQGETWDGLTHPRIKYREIGDGTKSV